MSDHHKQQLKHVIVVGGGSAGWLVAGLIASEHGRGDEGGVQVSVVESPDVPTIGVGEGTWPTMRTTLSRIGLSESEFLRHCHATFKQGTRFVGWRADDDTGAYYHPFSAPSGYPDRSLARSWLRQREPVAFADAVTVQGRVCDDGLAPKQSTTPEYAGVLNYAYHLDAGRFAELLREHCIGRLGVRHIPAHVTGLEGGLDEDIAALQTREAGRIAGDLFIDCTGARALLLGEHYQVPFVDRRGVLFIDSALACQVPYAQADAPLACQTNSTAQPAGWIWDIGLTNRRGVGHVYSSAHMEDEAAEAALRRYLAQTGAADPEGVAARKISFRPGHRARFWHRNCVAVGMSAGFLEPLEASALVLVELAGRMLADELPANRAVMDTIAQRFNEKFLYRWDRIVDFLKLHYVLSERCQDGFWRDNRAPHTIPDSLAERLELWRYHVPGPHDFSQAEEIFSAASYQYVLYGMGFETSADRGLSPSQMERADRLFAQNLRQATRITPHLPAHRALLDTIAQRGLPEAANG